MNKRAFVCFCLAALWMGLGSGSAAAQASLPIVYWAQGDLWSWTGVADAPGTPLTALGTVSGAALDPSGSRLAYRVLAPAIPPVLLDAALTAPLDLPTDLYLLDRVAGTTQSLALQPPDVDASSGAGMISRSLPAWSPDGSGLAWVHLAFQSTQAELRVLQLPAQSELMLASFTLPETLIPEIRWGAFGFALLVRETAGLPPRILRFALDGSALADMLPTPAPDEAIQMFDWVRVAGSEWLGVMYSSGRWQFFDPASGAEMLTSAVPVLRSAGGAGLRFGYTRDSGLFWETVTPDSVNASTAFAGPPGSAALSPEGTEVVFTGYPEFGALSRGDGGQWVTLRGSGSTQPESQIVAQVWWGAMTWFIDAP